MKTVFVSFVLLCMFAGMINGQTVLWQFNGLASGDWFGNSVAGVGDVNRDGYADIVVGAEGSNPVARWYAGQATVFSGKDGSGLYTFNGVAAGDCFGTSVSGAGDVDRDGFPDIIVGAHLASPGGRMGAGQATVFSGKDGSVLNTFNGVVAGDCFGTSVAGAGDVNRDGFPDIIVGARLASPGGRMGAGQATVFSGKNGSVLYTFNGVVAGDCFGTSVAGPGDVDRDGFPDIIVGAHMASPGWLVEAGQATVFSGKDGSVLYTFNGLAYGNCFGHSVAGAGDVNRDGFPDLIVGAEGFNPVARRYAGQATAFSGKDGSVLYTFNGVVFGDYFGTSVAGAGDVDRDGFPDIIVGACGADPGGRSNAGQVTVFSGKDGSVLYTFNGVASGDYFGTSVAGPGDVDRDGFPDIIVGARLASPGGRLWAGQATVFSVATTFISGSGCPSNGGTISLHLLAPGDGNLPYQVGSSLGTGPIPIDTRKLDLNPDALLQASVTGVWPWIFSGFRGVFDAKGMAMAAIHIPNDPALIGLRIHTAFVTLDPAAPSGIRSISNAFSFTITK